MPAVTETKVDGWVSCVDPRCVGYEQRPVVVTKRVAAFTYHELGGDGAVPQTAIERETVGVVQTDETCEHCGKPVVFSDLPRPEYAPVSGQDPLEILSISQQTQIRDAQTKNLETAKETAELRAMVAEMRAAHAEQMAEMKAELQRRKGGRPPKDPDE
jgi:hypothetical protein